jgi:hypothetical protein
MYSEAMAKWWDRICRQMDDDIECNMMHDAIQTLCNHTQYYVPAGDIPALNMAMEALTEKFNILYPDFKEK